MLSPNVSVISTTGTTEGDNVTLQCEDGLSLIISCNCSGMWSPSPAELICNSPQGDFNYVRIMLKCVLELLLATLFFLSQRGITCILPYSLLLWCSKQVVKEKAQIF